MPGAVLTVIRIFMLIVTGREQTDHLSGLCLWCRFVIEEDEIKDLKFTGQSNAGGCVPIFALNQE